MSKAPNSIIEVNTIITAFAVITLGQRTFWSFNWVSNAIRLKHSENASIANDFTKGVKAFLLRNPLKITYFV